MGNTLRQRVVEQAIDTMLMESIGSPAVMAVRYCGRPALKPDEINGLPVVAAMRITTSPNLRRRKTDVPTMTFEAMIVLTWDAPEQPAETSPGVFEDSQEPFFKAVEAIFLAFDSESKIIGGHEVTTHLQTTREFDQAKDAAQMDAEFTVSGMVKFVEETQLVAIGEQNSGNVGPPSDIGG